MVSYGFNIAPLDSNPFIQRLASFGIRGTRLEWADAYRIVIDLVWFRRRSIWQSGLLVKGWTEVEEMNGMVSIIELSASHSLLLKRQWGVGIGTSNSTGALPLDRMRWCPGTRFSLLLPLSKLGPFLPILVGDPLLDMELEINIPA